MGISESDSEIIVKLRSNPDVYKFFLCPHQITIEEHINWYRNNYIKDENRIDWVGTNKAQKSVGVFSIKRSIPCSAEVEVSYILDPAEYGKGYAKEAVRRLMTFCKDCWEAEEAIADIHKKNYASIHFIESLGYNLEYENDNFIRYIKKL